MNGTHKRARAAIGALLASGAMLFAGPADIAAARPHCEQCRQPVIPQLQPPQVFGGMNDLSDEGSTLLQMAMTNYSTLMQAQSNALKTIEDARASETQNLKK